MLAAAATVIKQAVDTLVSALAAFVNWVIQFVTTIINSFFGPIIQALNAAKYSYMLGFKNSKNVAYSDINATRQIRTSTLSSMLNAIQGDLYLILLCVVAISVILLVLVSGLTNVFSFAISMIAKLLITTLVGQALSAANFDLSQITYQLLNSPTSLVSFAQQLGAGEVENGGAVFSTQEEANRIWMLGITFFFLIAPVFGTGLGIMGLPNPWTHPNGVWGYVFGGVGLLCGLLSFFIGAYAGETHDFALGWMSIYEGAAGIVFGLGGALCASLAEIGLALLLALRAGLAGFSGIIVGVVALQFMVDD